MRRRTFIRGTLGAIVIGAAGCSPDGRDGSASAASAATPPSPPFALTESSAGRIVELTDGRLVVLDRSQRMLICLDSEGTTLWTIAGDELHGPVDAVEWNAHVAVPDRSGRVILVEADGSLSRMLPTGAPLASPGGAAVLDDGRLAVTDVLRHAVVALGADGSSEVLVEDQDGQGQVLNGPRGIVLDGEGHLHVASSGNARVEVFDQTGRWLRSYGGWSVGMRSPRALAIDAEGRALVADPVAGAVFAFERDALLERYDLVGEDGFAAAPISVQVLSDGSLRIGTYV